MYAGTRPRVPGRGFVGPGHQWYQTSAENFPAPVDRSPRVSQSGSRDLLSRCEHERRSPRESGSQCALPGVGPRLLDGSVMSPGRTAPFLPRTQEVCPDRENVVAPAYHTVSPPRGTVEVPGGD